MDFMQEALNMAGALALVILLLLAGLAWVRRTFGKLGDQEGNAVLRVLGGLRVGTGKQILLVEVGREVLVLGTTARDMTLLTRIVDETQVARLQSLTYPLANKLDNLMGGWKRGNLSCLKGTAGTNISQGDCVKNT